MSRGRVPSCAAAASAYLSSTPVKGSNRCDVRRPSGLDCDDLVEDDEDTFSQLSPIHINYDSSESDEELQSVQDEHASPSLSRRSLSSVSPVRFVLV